VTNHTKISALSLPFKEDELKKILMFVLLVFLVVFLSGCATPQNPVCPSSNSPEPIMVQVSENWTYIILNLNGTVEDNVKEIGNAIYQWEKLNPSRKITSLVPIYEPETAWIGIGGVVKGLSIYSEFKSY